MNYCSVCWGDYDNDSDLDILLTGSGVSKIYRNDSETANTMPASPNGLSTDISTESMTFSWYRATDSETPQDGLSYNLIIGNSEYEIFFNSPMANITTSFRSVPAIGNVGQESSWTYFFPELNDYPQVLQPDYWGVQAIDHGFVGSVFALDSLNLPFNILMVTNNDIMLLTDTLTWEVVSGDSIISYHVQIDDDSTFSSCEVNDTLDVALSGGGYNYSVELQNLEGNDLLIEGIRYYWRVKPNYTFGLPTAFTDQASSFWFGYETAIEDEHEPSIPEKFALKQNYPNPFNPTTVISYQLPVNSFVELTVFNNLGQKITTLVSKKQSTGYYTVNWDAKNFASGIYFYRIKAENFTDMKKMILLK